MVLHCDVDSNPVPRISWFFADVPLVTETASNASLFLESLTAEQEGLYTCVGDNGYGTMNTSLYLAVRCKSLCFFCYINCLSIFYLFISLFANFV